MDTGELELDLIDRLVDERNLHKCRHATDPISLENVDVLDEWICEEPSLLCRPELGEHKHTIC